MADAKVTVYESAIQSHFEPGGGVFKEAEIVGVQSVLRAKELAPKRTNRLAESVQRFGRGAASRFGYTVTIAATAPYAKYVLGGTRDIITPTHSTFLALHPGNGFGWVYKRYVHGQDATPFLSDAVSEILRGRGYPVTFL